MAEAECTSLQIKAGLCVDDDNGGDHVSIGGDQNTPGSGGDGGGNEPVDGPPAGGGGGGGDTGGSGGDDGSGGDEDPSRCLRVTVGCEADDPPPADPVIPPISDHDVAVFAPVVPAPVTEPDEGLALTGMPMNAVASAGIQSIGGMLFTLPVTVTFTPESYTFDYGDGQQLTAATGGARWTDLGAADYTATATSHAYAERGTYQVVVSVSYSAVADFGVWGVFPVNGLVTVTSPAASVRAVDAETVLVNSTCDENPSGPGC
ncbi:MAG: hypothetical protein QM607_07090 [Microbacterium sp.]